MGNEKFGPMVFIEEMSERQISAHEFFTKVLLESINRNFGLKKIIISYFDTHGNFLSWVDINGTFLNSEQHPYNKFMQKDIIRKNIYKSAVSDGLTYFNTIPRLYKSTNIINSNEYENSSYVRFIEENFSAHYSLNLAFGINAYIQVTFFKNFEDGDFTEPEVQNLNEIYVYIANAYKNFKKHEQAIIVSKIQRKVIELGEKAYFIMNELMNIMSYSEIAQIYLEDVLGTTISEQISNPSYCISFPFRLNGDNEYYSKDIVKTHTVKEYAFTIHHFDYKYSNGIIDRYYWVTINKNYEKKDCEERIENHLLTKTEQKVAELLYNNLTYKAIADELVVSYHTIKKHVQNIYIKCEVNSRHELYRYLEKNKK